MRKTEKAETENRFAVDVYTLAKMLDCGEQTARQIGSDAGAVMRFGRRVLYNVNKIQIYLDSVSE